MPEWQTNAWFSQWSVNIHSPAARSLVVGLDGEAHWLCFPCYSVPIEGSAEADHGAFAAVSWTGKKKKGVCLFLVLKSFFSATTESLFC